MWYWLIPLILLILVLAYLLFAPIHIQLDSQKGIAEIRFHRLASAILRAGDSLVLEINIAWWHRCVDILQSGSREKKENVKKVHTGSQKKNKLPVQKLLAIARSFRIHRFIVHINTGDMASNGVLFPLFFWLGCKTRKDISITFNEATHIEIHTSNTLARMIRAYLSK